MAAKITFDASTRHFIVNGPPVNGVIVINMNEDVYSDGKEDWVDDGTYPDLSKMIFPVDAKGGEDFGSIVLGDSYLITNSWVFEPYEADHLMQIVGNTGTDDGRELVIDTVGNYRVRVENIVSAIVEIREGMDAADANIKLDTIIDSTLGQKVLAYSTDPTAGDPGFLVLWEADGITLIGHKEVWEDRNQTIGYRGRGIGWESAVIAGLPAGWI
jgi:hypothetical protein